MNELTIYDRVHSPEAFVAAMGRHIARSGMFGCETEDQGCVLALECAARRMPPLSLSQRYHLIKGKLSMKADAMLGGLIDVGGKYEVESHTPELASITITRDRKKQTFSLSWDDAQQEPFVYEGKEPDVLKMLAAGNKPKLKAKYATPRSRMQMLWARVVSDGCRVMAPDVVAGYYAPEESADIVEAEPVRVVEAKGPTMAELAGRDGGDSNGDEGTDTTATGPEAKSTAPAATEEGDVSTVEATAEAATPATHTPNPADAEIAANKAKAEAGMAKAKVAEAKLTGKGVEGSAAPADKPCSSDQVDSVKAIYNDLLPRGFNGDVLRSMVAELGAERVSQLSAGGCETLIRRMMSVKGIYGLADELKMPADTLKGVLAKANVEQVWQLPPNLLEQLDTMLTKRLAERSKN